MLFYPSRGKCFQLRLNVDFYMQKIGTHINHLGLIYNPFPLENVRRGTLLELQKVIGITLMVNKEEEKTHQSIFTI